jgi:hypothetical protein
MPKSYRLPHKQVSVCNFKCVFETAARICGERARAIHSFIRPGPKAELYHCTYLVADGATRSRAASGVGLLPAELLVGIETKTDTLGTAPDLVIMSLYFGF